MKLGLHSRKLSSLRKYFAKYSERKIYISYTEKLKCLSKILKIMHACILFCFKKIPWPKISHGTCENNVKKTKLHEVLDESDEEIKRGLGQKDKIQRKQ